MEETIEESWYDIILRNDLNDYLISGVILLVILALYIIYEKKFSTYLINKFTGNEVMLGVINSLTTLISLPLMLATGLQLTTVTLMLPTVIVTIIDLIFVTTLAIYLIRSLFDFLDAMVILFKNKSNQGHLIDFFEFILRITISLIVGLWFLNIIGVDVNAFLAGLGILGLGFAFALQNVISDLFASIAIFVDRPFEIGDTIRIGTDIGTVEKIGLKSTQLRTPLGNQLIVSNQELTNQRIHNMKRMSKRRVDLILGVSYDTPIEKLEKIPLWIKQIVETFNDTEFVYAYFVEMAASSLDSKVVYYINNSDAINWLENQQSINLAILKKFNEQKIDIPYPTHKVIS